MQTDPIARAKPIHSPMVLTLPAGSRTRPEAAAHKRPSGRSRSLRIDPSIITSPTPRSRTQISPGVREAIGRTGPAPPHNHSPRSRRKAHASDEPAGVVTASGTLTYEKPLTRSRFKGSQGWRH
jgi:hypothetical protein